MSRFGRSLVGFLCGTLLIGALTIGAEPKPAEVGKQAKASSKTADAKDRALTDAESYELYKTLADTMYQVEQNYVKKVDRRELMEAAIRGVLDKLDPYSNYINPSELSRFKTSVDNEFGGIGIMITTEGGQLKVLAPIVGSPAYEAGMQAGDAIVEIEGKPTKQMPIDDAIKSLKGEAGTKVNVTVMHALSGKREKLTINREIVQLETVLGERRKDDDSWDFMLDEQHKIGCIRINAFSRDTADDVETALKQLQKAGFKGLIIDLRFNPGGLLKSATDIADLFVSEGVIVTTEGRNTVPRVVTARKPGTYEGFPIAILVNHHSASASEIVAACLQDHHKAVVIGERTWGKGSVQNVIELEDGRSALKLTTASYHRPSGRNIHREEGAKDSDVWGVSPDKGYEVKLSDTEMAQLIADRRTRDLLLLSHSKAALKDRDSKDPKAKSDDDKPDDQAKATGKPAVDRQLQKALDYLTGELARK